jgi:hypothetical protein
MGHEIVEQTAETLDAKVFVEAAEMDENHKGPFVRAFVANRIDEQELYDTIDQYPCYVEVVLEER